MIMETHLSPTMVVIVQDVSVVLQNENESKLAEQSSLAITRRHDDGGLEGGTS